MLSRRNTFVALRLRERSRCLPGAGHAGCPGITPRPNFRSIVPKHFFTVDVEEHFQVSAFERTVDRADWDRLESRVARNVDVLLELLARHDARGTFFVLGWIAERHPGVVQAIAGAGHEVASHGQDHRRVTHQTPDEFRASVRQSKAVLEDLTGTPVLGFRAPSFSIVPGGSGRSTFSSRRATATTRRCFPSGDRAGTAIRRH